MKELLIGLSIFAVMAGLVVIIFLYPWVFFLIAILGLSYLMGCQITGKGDER